MKGLMDLKTKIGKSAGTHAYQAENFINLLRVNHRRVRHLPLVNHRHIHHLLTDFRLAIEPIISRPGLKNEQNLPILRIINIGLKNSPIIKELSIY